MVQPLKIITNEKRPNLSFSNNSFPSGHTATCFMGAAILHQELKPFYPAASFGGYGFGLLTATLRLFNNKHWFSDVVSGAAIGFMAAKLTCVILKKIYRERRTQSQIIPLQIKSASNQA